MWIATSGDIPGLVLESGSFDALLERVRFASALTNLKCLYQGDVKCAPLVFFYSDGVTFRYSRGVQFVDTLLAANADPSFRRQLSIINY